VNRDFNYSFWELQQYFKSYDLIVIGSGIVGLSTAISFSELNRKASVLVLERGFLPEGASTKNAGFACFGSAGELLSDLSHIPEDVVWETVNLRWKGLQLLRKRLTDRQLDYHGYGGYELFRERHGYERCITALGRLNAAMRQHVGLKDCYAPAPAKGRMFSNHVGAISNRFEGQIDTGLMMHNLLRLAQSKGVMVLNNVNVERIEGRRDAVDILTNRGTFTTGKVVVATNGFASTLLKINDVFPARAQVLVTSPIDGLKFKGCFHFEEGYYYFRNIGRRLLFGGGRNLDIKGESTTSFALNERIHNELDRLLGEMLLPGHRYSVEQRWTGIMGVGKEKMPIIRPVGRNILAAVRMGGMGVAIGSMVGELAASKVS
jgi:gamma-glutamylputrescine oxidase